MAHTMKSLKSGANKIMTQMGMGAAKKAKPVVSVSPATAEEIRFSKGQEALDKAGVAFHEALSQKAMDKAGRHLAKMQQKFDVLYKAHKKAWKG